MLVSGSELIWHANIKFKWFDVLHIFVRMGEGTGTLVSLCCKHPSLPDSYEKVIRFLQIFLSDSLSQST